MNGIDDYLSPYPMEIQEVANEIRAIIKDTVPGVSEKLVRGWQLIGYRAPAAAGSRYFCFIAPQEGRVRLGFEWGALMADEAGLLQDKGKQVRSIYINDSASLNREILRSYIQDALRVALLSKEEKANLSLQRAAEDDLY